MGIYRHLLRIYQNTLPAVYGRAGCIPVHYQQHGRVGCTPVNLRTFFVNACMPDCLASGQSDAEMTKNADSGTRSVPE
jgi:hypothetical protein